MSYVDKDVGTQHICTIFWIEQDWILIGFETKCDYVTVVDLKVRFKFDFKHIFNFPL